MIRWLRQWPLWSFGMVAFLVGSALPVQAAVPAPFTDALVQAVDQPTALAFLPDGRLLIAEKNGPVEIYKNGALVSSPALNLTATICTESERGVLGLAVHPDFATKPYVYVYYTHKSQQNNCTTSNTAPDPFAAAPYNRVSRFTMSGDTLDPQSELVLIDHSPSYAGNHNGGDIHFGKDGLLYISIGDSGCYYANTSQCAGGNPAAREEFTVLGKILRVTDDGSIPTDNPYRTTGERCNTTGRTSAPYAGKRCQETFAWGLRNPFRMAFDPNAAGTRFYINDVGQGTWEEIDEGKAGADYGWNVREGHCANGSTTNCGAPPAGMTNPIFDYQHTGDCNAAGVQGNSITGGAFVPNGVWPAEYDGDYLFSEYVCGKIFRLDVQTNGTFAAKEFATGLGNSSAVHMTFGTINGQTALYYTVQKGAGLGEVRKIFTSSSVNRSPQALLSASPTSGVLPLDVTFNGSGSTDPDGDALTYAWDFGDGQTAPASASPTATHRYTQQANVTATLTVSDGKGGTGTATITISAGDAAPIPIIEQPTKATRFAVGQTIVLQGSATDAEDGPLPGSQLSWTVTLHHNEHTHPLLAPTTGLTATIVAPPPEDLAATRTSYLEIALSATDSQGATTIVTSELRPALVNVTFATTPTNLLVRVNDVPISTTQTIVSWQNYQLNLLAPPQQDADGHWLYPTGWSNGGLATQTIATPTNATTYTASFEPGYGLFLPVVVH